MKRPFGTLLNALVILCVLAAVLAPYRHGRPERVLDAALGISDFGAFYCGASIARAHGDPYALAPLVACEVERVYEPGGTSYASRGTDPAPLPPYDFALLAPLTLLPYRVAGLLWTVLLVAATFGAAALLARLASVPFWLVLAALAFADGAVCFTYGQEQPLVTVALVAAAALLQAKRAGAAAVVASVAWIEPHVGLAAVLALFLWQPAARGGILAAGAVLAALGLALCGPATNLEYLTGVLPAHGFAEITVNFQYSLTSLLYTLGVPGTVALRAASFQYAAFVVAGAALAGPLARRLGPPALLFFPVLCAVTGGPFIHITQIASALPFGLYLAGRGTRVAAAAWSAEDARVAGVGSAAGDARRAAGVGSAAGDAGETGAAWTAGATWVGTALVALPWPAYGASGALFATDAALIGGAAFASLREQALLARALFAAALFGLYLLSGPALRRLPATDLRPQETGATVRAAGFDQRLASGEYAYEMRRHDAIDATSPQRLAARVPTWAGLVLLCGLGLAAARGKRS